MESFKPVTSSYPLFYALTAGNLEKQIPDKYDSSDSIYHYNRKWVSMDTAHTEAVVRPPRGHRWEKFQHRLGRIYFEAGRP